MIPLTGLGIRDFIHVLDVAEGHKAALLFIKENYGAHEFNLGTGKGSSVFEILKTFEKVNNLKVPFKIYPRRIGDVSESFADATKAFNILGWKANFDLESMCKSSWMFEKKNF